MSSPHIENPKLKDLDDKLKKIRENKVGSNSCLLYTSPSPRDPKTSRMPSSA